MNRFSYLPLDIELVIYRYLYELNFSPVMDELKKESKERETFYGYIQKRCFRPYLFADKLIRKKVITNPYSIRVIARYVHYKKFSVCLQGIIKPVQHIYFE
jgi:hypothetical protein